MSADDAIKRLDEIIMHIETGMIAISEELATNGMALIVNRIQQVGIAGRSYSTRPLPTYFFEGRENNAGGRAIIAKAKKKKKGSDVENGISYKQWREANGLQTAHVDLTFTGRMFMNLQVIGTVRNGDNFVTIIGGIDKEVQDKLKWNAARFGDFFLVNAEERGQLEDLFRLRITDLLKKAGI